MIIIMIVTIITMVIVMLIAIMQEKQQLFPRRRRNKTVTVYILFTELWPIVDLTDFRILVDVLIRPTIHGEYGIRYDLNRGEVNL